MPKLIAEGLSPSEFEVEKRATSSTTMTSLESVERTKTVPCKLTFKDVKYSIYTKKPGTAEAREYRILNGISGELMPGSLTAIMGPTGSGKTSLLNALANRMPRIKGGSLEGQLLVNGSSIRAAHGASRFARLSAYVMQDDVLNPFLTVRETLGLAASFQLPPSTTREERDALVTVVVAELGLSKVIDSLVGSPEVRGVSGGERKRANIGVELIKNPSALFLDEPTSGLDSFQAKSVMECLSSLAARGRTVAASIHQPRSSIYSMFQQLLLVSEGRSIYFGPAAAAVDHFSAIDPAFACPALFNPAVSSLARVFAHSAARPLSLSIFFFFSRRQRRLSFLL
jgi:ABC-type multidrug transport system ATPase subunit